MTRRRGWLTGWTTCARAPCTCGSARVAKPTSWSSWMRGRTVRSAGCAGRSDTRSRRSSASRSVRSNWDVSSLDSGERSPARSSRPWRPRPHAGAGVDRIEVSGRLCDGADARKASQMNPRVVEAINRQINSELSASYSYLGMSAWCEGQKLTGAARWLRLQSQEEYMHAMKLFDSLLARNSIVDLRPIQPPALPLN